MRNNENISKSRFHALVVVAHPDDETLWAGGMIMMHPHWCWRVVSLCRGEDQDRRTRFFNVMKHLDAAGNIYNLDDGPMQRPLSDNCIREAVALALQNRKYDLIVTHSPFGEYTRHLRHEEAGRAILQMWEMKRLITQNLWLFAYSDNGGNGYPRPLDDADLIVELPDDIWHRKLTIIHDVYNFASDSWEYSSTLQTEAFWCFDSIEKALFWQKQHTQRIAQEEMAAAINGSGH